MKKAALVFVLIIVASVGHSQSFEGIVRWKIEMEYHDTTSHSAWLEKTAKAYKKTSFVPAGLVIKIKRASLVSTYEGGVMDQSSMLEVPGKDSLCMIINQTKQFGYRTKINFERIDSASLYPAPRVTRTSEVLKIAGYNCTKYISELLDHDGTLLATAYWWTTTEIRNIDVKAFVVHSRFIGVEGFPLKYIEGLPLKMVSGDEEETTTIELVEIKKQRIPASDFKIPVGYAKIKL